LTLPTSGRISFADIATSFGATPPYSATSIAQYIFQTPGTRLQLASSFYGKEGASVSVTTNNVDEGSAIEITGTFPHNTTGSGKNKFQISGSWVQNAPGTGNTADGLVYDDFEAFPTGYYDLTESGGTYIQSVDLGNNIYEWRLVDSAGTTVEALTATDRVIYDNWPLFAAGEIAWNYATGGPVAIDAVNYKYRAYDLLGTQGVFAEGVWRLDTSYIQFHPTTFQAKIILRIRADQTDENTETFNVTLGSVDQTGVQSAWGVNTVSIAINDTSIMPNTTANAWLQGGFYTQDFHKRSFSTMSNEVTAGALTTTNSGGGCGGTNGYYMIVSCFTGANTTNSDKKDLSTTANAIVWGNTTYTHAYGMADGNETQLMYYGGWNGSSNTRQQSKQDYASASSALCGQGTVTGTRHSFCSSDFIDYIQAGAGDNNSFRTSATWRTTMSSCSVTGGPGLPSVMYVMQAAGNDTYNCISGNRGNNPYTPLNQINRYAFATNSQTNNWLAITGIDSGVNISDRDDQCFHGGSTSGWQKFSISSGGSVVYFGSTSVTSGAKARGPGV